MEQERASERWTRARARAVCFVRVVSLSLSLSLSRLVSRLCETMERFVRE